MEQRPLRLGDIVDDYCPRERRVTNHAIVAVVEDAIRQTRCTTCDAEHVFKGAKEPRLRKKSPTTGLYEQVLADVTGSQGAPGSPPVPDGVTLSAGGRAEVPAAELDRVHPEAATESSPESREDESLQDGVARPDEGWPAHRQLIRATLPRTENDQPTPRPIPEFTMHQRPPSRGGRGFRHSDNGNGPAHGGFGQSRPHPHSGRRHRGKKRPR